MRKKRQYIPVNTMNDDFGTGIIIDRLAFTDLPDFAEWGHAERHDRHSFFLMEKGTVSMEIDFQRYTFKAATVIYMHPNQVHRILAFEDVTVGSWAINNENLNPEYLKLLESIAPAKPLLLNEETVVLISEMITLGIKLSERKNDRLYHASMKDSCNALVTLIISQYLEQTKSTDKLTRFEIVTKAFRQLLERNYSQLKRPADYAQQLNISTPYLNECIKETTGHSVSYHIQQRIILEAKRLLYHSDKSVKEIAADLGFDDYPYFSRLFTKATGMSALAFRNKNLD
ncbi:helix-turn-helix domain-containing protein [Emticicia fontis]